MRKWKQDFPVGDKWTAIQQIGVQSVYRSEILSMAHDTPMSSHIGINKTYQTLS